MTKIKNIQRKKYKKNSNVFLSVNQKALVQAQILKYLEVTNKAKYNIISKCTKQSRCNTKPCLYCTDIKALNNINKIKKVMCSTKEDNLAKHFIISIENVSVEDVPDALNQLNNTFNNFKRKKEYKLLSGYIKKTEISYIYKNKAYKPHLHFILLIPKNKSRELSNKFLINYFTNYFNKLNNNYKINVVSKNVKTDEYISNIIKYVGKNNYRLIFNLINTTKYQRLSKVKQIEQLHDHLLIPSTLMFGKWEIAISKNLKQYL